MPINYIIDSEFSLVHTSVTGLLTMEETLDYFDTLQRDPKCPAEVLEIVDFSDVEDFILQYSQQPIRISVVM